MTMMPKMSPTLGAEQVTPIVGEGFSPKPKVSPHATRVAVIVAHGMGQQVPYETIEDVVQAIQRGMADAHDAAEIEATKAGKILSKDALKFHEPEMRSARLGIQNKADVETELVRAEIKVTDEDDNPREVHVYEAYWAPLTEGKVTITDVMSFLWNAGWTGFWNTGAKTFKQWMFGAEQQFMLSRFKLFAALTAVVALLGSLTMINAVAVAAAASRVIGSSKTFPSGGLLGGLTWDFVIADAAVILIALGVLVFGSSRIGFIRKVGWGFISLGAIGIGVSAAFMCGHLASLRLMTRVTPGGGWPTFVTKRHFVVLALWALEIFAASRVRFVMIQYVGDVAAYISGARVSKFWELRQQIWNTCMKVARAVYRARTADDKDFLYHKVVMVGHSLGSVIGYDLMNGLLMEEKFSSVSLEIQKRTPMFLTFGSPLDKTAFFFRTRKDMDSPIREVGSAAVQPMIADYGNRPEEWINLWSRADIVSGHLDYYDPPNMGNARHKSLVRGLANPRAIHNEIDPEATKPLAAHVQYWTGKMFASYLVRGIFK